MSDSFEEKKIASDKKKQKNLFILEIETTVDASVLPSSDTFQESDKTRRRSSALSRYFFIQQKDVMIKDCITTSRPYS